MEVVSNGSICAGYRWTQEMHEVTLAVELPPGTAKRDVVCKITPGVRAPAASRQFIQSPSPCRHLLLLQCRAMCVPQCRAHARNDPVCPQTLECGLRGQPPILEGAMFAKVKVDDCMWQLQDSHQLIVTLPKLIIDESQRRVRLRRARPCAERARASAGGAAASYLCLGVHHLVVELIRVAKGRLLLEHIQRVLLLVEILCAELVVFVLLEQA